jgi:phytoene dehydrogenase-like protein
VHVVGAGPNGLAAALAMAREGFRVTVHEAMNDIGGGTRTDALTLPGFLHDVCSAVHPMAAASPFFRRLPLESHGLEWVHPPLLVAHPFDDGTAATLSRSIAETADSLDRADRPAYEGLLRPFVERWEDVVDQAFAPLMRFPRTPLLMARLGRLGLRPALGMTDRWFEGDRARSLFLGIAAHVLLPMEKRPSAAFGLMLLIAGHGVGWPIARSGSQRIAEALASLLRDHGGTVQTGSRVLTLDALPPAAATFLDLTPRQILGISGERLPGRYRRALERYRYGPGVFKVDWAISEPIPWKATECARAGTVHLGPSTADVAESSRAAWEGRACETPYVVLTQPTRFDPTRAPAGKHVAWAYCHVPHGSVRDMGDAIERQVERFAPGFRETILARHTMNTRQLEAHNPNLVGGDITGGVQDLAQTFFRPARRIDPYGTPVRGLYICSASTPPGGAVHGMCGFNAARSALSRLGIDASDRV